MEVVSRMLGHASIRETERIYAKILPKIVLEQTKNFYNKQLDLDHENRNKDKKHSPNGEKSVLATLPKSEVLEKNAKHQQRTLFNENL